MIFDDLRAIQLRHGFLPKAELEGLSARTQMPLYQIHSVASFYPHFHLTVPPKAEVRVCADMSCHLNGAMDLRADLERRFVGARAEDVQIRDVSCLGRCDLAPAVAINDQIFTDVTAERAEQITRGALRGDPVHEDHPTVARVACASDPYGEGGVGEKYRVLTELTQTKAFEEVLGELKLSELKGMGGAGFPTSMKWDLVRKQPATPKYVVCNADESEPGTIKDRFIMTHLPHLLIEGMAIAGLVTGAKIGILYIRHEYHLQEEILGEELRRCYQMGLLGKNILKSGLDFDLQIFVSPGGYICGEETALIEAIEGHRAEPRNKPPFPGGCRTFWKAHRAEQRRNLRQRAADSGARRRVVQIARPRWLARIEIRGRQWPRRQPGNFRSSHGDLDARSFVYSRGGNSRWTGVKGVCAIRTVFGISASVDGRREVGL